MDDLPKLNEESLFFLREDQKHKAIFIEIYRLMYTAREIDLLEEQYVARRQSGIYVLVQEVRQSKSI